MRVEAQILRLSLQSQRETHTMPLPIVPEVSHAQLAVGQSWGEANAGPAQVGVRGLSRAE